MVTCVGVTALIIGSLIAGVIGAGASIYAVNKNKESVDETNKAIISLQSDAILSNPFSSKMFVS